MATMWLSNADRRFEVGEHDTDLIKRLKAEGFEEEGAQPLMGMDVGDGDDRTITTVANADGVPADPSAETTRLYLDTLTIAELLQTPAAEGLGLTDKLKKAKIIDALVAKLFPAQE